MVNKKGLSGVIVTMIIVAFSLVLITVLWISIQGILEDDLNEVSLGPVTIGLEIKNVKVSGNDLEVGIKRNPGPGELVKLKFVISNGTNSLTIVKNTSIKEMESDKIILSQIDLGEIVASEVVSVSVDAILVSSSGEEFVGNVVDSYDVVEGSSSSSSGGGCENNGECTGGNECTDKICSAGTCFYPPANDGEDCSPDGTCQSGVCVPSEGFVFDGISWWKFDGDADDSGTGGNDGSLIGDTDCNVAGKFNLACEFDGVEDYINITDSDDFYFGADNFTISMWIKPNGVQEENDILYSQLGTTADYLLWDWGTSGKLRFLSKENTITQAFYSMTNAQTWTSGIWYHVVLIREGPNVYMYKEGNSEPLTVKQKDAIGSNSLPNVAAPVKIAGDFQSRYFNGGIDEVMIWDRALSEEEVQELYTADLS